MSRRDPKVRLLHMRDFARKAIELTRGKTWADLASDEVLRLALTHLVELVGEAASQVAAETQAQHPEIPWPKIISTRNRLIHGYDYVDDNVLWDTLSINLPQLLSQLERILGRQE
jgi:uncharacterized protein with HEPN domain